VITAAILPEWEPRAPHNTDSTLGLLPVEHLNIDSQETPATAHCQPPPLSTPMMKPTKSNGHYSQDPPPTVDPALKFTEPAGSSKRDAAGPPNSSLHTSVTDTARATVSTHVATPCTTGRGLVNLGATSFVNAVLQCLHKMLPLRRYLQETTTGIGSSPPSLREVTTDCLQLMDISTPVHLRPTRIIKNLSRILPGYAPNIQQDSHEFLIRLLSQLYEGGEPHMRGSLSSIVTCHNCQFRSSTTEAFLDLSLEVKDAQGCLQDCMQAFIAEETLSGDNAFHCTGCDAYQEASKRLLLSGCPDILILHLKRQQH